MMMRNLLVREEGEALVIGSGVRPQWIQSGKQFGIERTFTPHGQVSIVFRRVGNEIEAMVRGEWRAKPPRLDVRVPGHRIVNASGDVFRLRAV